MPRLAVDPGTSAIVVGLAGVIGKLWYDLRNIKADLRKVGAAETTADAEEERSETDRIRTYGSMAAEYMGKYDALLIRLEVLQKEVTSNTIRIHDLERELAYEKAARQTEHAAADVAEAALTDCRNRESAMNDRIRALQSQCEEFRRAQNAALVLMDAVTRGKPEEGIPRAAAEQIKEILRAEAEYNRRHDREAPPPPPEAGN